MPGSPSDAGATATVGTPMVVSARDTLIPLPPASEDADRTRMTSPRRTAGTSSVRSMLGLGVIVTIT